MHIERCSCNALIVTFSAKRAKEWRENHRHEMPVADTMPEMPMTVESVSSHERGLPFGFTLELEGDLS